MKPLFPAVWRIVESSLFNTNGTLFKIALPLVAQQLLKLLLVNSRNEIRNMILFTFADFLFLVSAFCGVLRLPLTIIIGFPQFHRADYQLHHRSAGGHQTQPVDHWGTFVDLLAARLGLDLYRFRTRSVLCYDRH